MTEGHRLIWKSEIPIMSQVISEKCSNDEGSVGKNSMAKWIWFIQEHSTTRMQGDTQEQLTSFLPRSTLEPLKELSDSLASWVAP